MAARRRLALTAPGDGTLPMWAAASSSPPTASLWPSSEAGWWRGATSLSRVVVVVGSGCGPVATGGRDGRAEGGVVGAWAATAIGATPGGGPGGSGGAVVEEDPAVLALEGATAGRSVATG